MKTNFTNQFNKRGSTLNVILQFGLLAVMLVLMAVLSVKAQTISPIKYWTFNGSNAATDSMGSTNLNFTTYNCQYTVGNNGPVGKYITFDANSNLVDGGPVSLSTGLTIEFLFKPGYKFNTTNLIKRADGAFSIRIEYPKMIFYTSHKSSSGATVEDNFVIDLNGLDRKSYGYYVDGDWHHMVFKLDAASGSKQIWVDGMLASGFSKTLTPGTFQNSGNINFFLNHTISYVKYFGSIDELAVYNTAIPNALIYKHYLGIQSGQPYNFVNNYGGSIPAAPAVTGAVDVNEFAPGHPSVSMTAIEQLNLFPIPRYKPGNTLLKNFNWMDPKYMGGLFQTGVTTSQAVNNSVVIQTELAKNFNYYFNVELGNDQFDIAWANAANANPNFKLGLVTFRAQLNGNTPQLSVQNKPNDHYLQNSSGQFIDKDGNVTSNKIWRPTAPTSSYIGDGNAIMSELNNLFTRLNRGVDWINENGEIFPFPDEVALAKDPVVTAAKNASGLDWQTFLSRKFKENETQAYRNIFMAHPRLANAKFTEFSIDGYPPQYSFKYSEARQVNSLINNQYYPTTSFYPRWPSNWRNWMAAWHGWQWIVESRVNELPLNDRLFSPFVAAGWDPNEEVNIRPAQWLGLMKTLGMAGAEFYYSCFFSIGAPWPDSKNWIWQAVIPSYAQGIASRYEEFLRNGELMDGDVPNSYTNPTAPAYNFWSGDLRKLIVVRKHNSVNKYAITGTVQPNTNMMGNSENESIAQITLSGQVISFKVRRQGSTYIYDKTNPAAPVFYQLDGWHEQTHPSRWTRDFYLEGELFDNTNSQVTIKTSVPAGTPAGNFTNFTSYVAWPDNTVNPQPVEYKFTPRSAANNELYVWVRARSRGGVTTSMNVQVDNNTAKTIGCISDTAWTWYRYDACNQLPVNIQGLTIQEHTFRITPANDKLEIDQILLTTSSSLILNSAPPACGAATATITASGNTTFCTGGNVILTASTGTSYQWMPGGQTTQSITVNATGSYYVTVGSGTGCSAVANPVSVSVLSAPTAVITAGGSTTLCAGASVMLTAPAGMTSYLWTPGGQTTQSITTGTAGFYTVKVTNAGGCSTTSNPVQVTVGQTPTAVITAGGATSFCQGGNVSLTASAANSYLWFPGGQTSQSINVNSTGTYYVRVTGSGGCTATSSNTTVTVYALPTATITAGGSTSLCAGGNVNLTANAGAAYLWLPDGQTTQTINAVSAGTYTVRVTNSSGCSATSQATNVTVAATVNASISASGSTALLPGENVTLTASGGSTYLWSPGGQTTSVITVDVAGSYTVTAFNASGCSGTSAPVVVTVNTIPNPPATITASNTTGMLCPGNFMTLTANPGSSYFWTPGGETTQSINITTAGTYTVEVTDISGSSSAIATIDVTYKQAPDMPAITSAYIPGSSFQLTAYEPTAHSYLWSTGSTSQAITVNNTGTFTVRAINGLGCKSDPQTVTVTSLAAQPCGTPNMLSHYGITKNEAVVSWNPAVTADSFRVEYTRLSTASVFYRSVAGSQSQVMIEDLVEGESYKWNVVAICSGTQSGSIDRQFTTLSGPLPCGSTPQYLSTDLVNSTMAKISWFDTQADRFVIRYRAVGTLPYQFRRVYTSLTNGVIEGLIPSTTYEWSVRSMCGANVSLYSQPKYFTTLSACPSVGTVTVSDIGFNKVRLNWTPTTNADTILVRYAVSGTTNYRLIKFFANPDPGMYWIMALDPQTTYNAWVATKCISGSTSMWGSGVTFTTFNDPNPRYSPEAGAIHLNAYPNPTKYQIGYVFESKDDKPYTVKVCDMAGRELLSEVREANEGLTSDKLNLPGYSAGLYMLIVQKGPLVGRFKFNIHE